MRNDTCVACGKKFEPRKGKLYCSDSCKQSAWNEKNKIPKNFKEGEIQSLEVIKNVIYQVEYDEYLKVKEVYEKEVFRDNLSLIDYCFIRKNQVGNPNMKQIVDWIKNLNFEFAEEGSVGHKTYVKFVNDFYNGQILINYNNPKTGEKHTTEPDNEKTKSK